MHHLLFEFYTSLDYKDQNQIVFHRLILKEQKTAFPAITFGTPDNNVAPSP